MNTLKQLYNDIKLFLAYGYEHKKLGEFFFGTAVIFMLIAVLHYNWPFTFGAFLFTLYFLAFWIFGIYNSTKHVKERQQTSQKQ